MPPKGILPGPGCRDIMDIIGQVWPVDWRPEMKWWRVDGRLGAARREDEVAIYTRREVPGNVEAVTRLKELCVVTSAST